MRFPCVQRIAALFGDAVTQLKPKSRVNILLINVRLVGRIRELVSITLTDFDRFTAASINNHN